MTTRTYQHIIDTRSIKKVLNALPDHWVVRELTERDYGIDLHIEVFDKIDQSGGKHDSFESSGNILNIQVKGTTIAKEVKPSKEGTVDFWLPRKSLTYYEKFAIPFILFRVDVSSDDGEIYFVWLQKYIKKKLDQDSPDWRTEKRCHPNGKVKEAKYKIEIPVNNTLSENIEKLEKIAPRIKYLEELTEYIEIFSSINRVADDTSVGIFHADSKTYEWLVHEIRKISRLHALIKVNNCGITSSEIKDLLSYFSNIKSSGNSNRIADYPHKEEFLRLLKAEAFSNLAMEELQDDMCGTTVY
jgi:hypothetical protein